MTIKELKEKLIKIPDDYIVCIQCFGEFNKVITDTVDDVQVKDNNKICILMGAM